MIQTNELEIAAGFSGIKSIAEFLGDTAKLFRCPIGVLLLVRKNCLVIETAVGVDDSQFKTQVIPFGAGLTGSLFGGKELGVSVDLKSREIDGREPYYSGSLACTKLIFNNTVIGMLNICRPEPLPPFSYQELQSLISYGNQMAYAVVNQYLIERRTKELEEAERALLNANRELRNDIEKREIIEAALHETQYQQKAILDNIPDMAWLKDVQGRFIAVNGHFEKACGHVLKDLIGKTDLDVWPKHMADRYMGADHEVVRSRQQKRIEEPLLESGKVVKYIETIRTPVFNNSGEVIGTAGVARDVTARRQYENDLRQANNKLVRNERALQNMLYDLKKAHDDIRHAQSQLLQSEKLASIGQLAAGVAHEINNPISFVSSNLTTLSSYADIMTGMFELSVMINNALSSGDETMMRAAHEKCRSLLSQADVDFMVKDTRPLIQESLDGIDRIKKIVKDLKEFARKDDEVKTAADLNSIIDGVLNIVWNEIKYRAELIKEYSPLPPIECNQQQLGQVFINILVNAVQAIKTRGKISIRTYRQGDCACAEIADTGSGIAPENLNKIFDPFFSTKEVGKGTGLGLSISYDIVKKHGGAIEVASELNKGTTFRIILPITPDVPV